MSAIKIERDPELKNPVAAGRAIYTEMMKTRGGKRHKDLWARLICAHWLEAVEVARVYSIGATTARGVAHLAVDGYLQDRKNNSVQRCRAALRYMDDLTSEAERGRNMRRELEPLARELGIGELVREIEIIDADEVEKGGDLEEGACTLVQAAPRVRTLSAADPTARSYAHRTRAERIAAQFPAPTGTISRPTDHIGRAKPEERVEWIEWIATVARHWAGPLYPNDLHMLSGAPHSWCKAMLAEYHAHLAHGLTPDQRRTTTLSLIAEAEAIAREALALHASASDDRAQGGALKLALDALNTRARLAGADKVALERPSESANSDWVSHSRALGLSDEDLRAVADIASRAMSRRDDD